MFVILVAFGREVNEYKGWCHYPDCCAI